MSCYSIEISRLLMSATQENDVLLKQICNHFGDSAENEVGYRGCFKVNYPKLLDIEVEIPRYELSFKPFADWKTEITPSWWIANNKVKHHRNKHFYDASLKNMLSSVCGLFLLNIFYYLKVKNNEQIYPGPKLFNAVGIVKSISPSVFGMVPNFKLPE